MYVAPVAKLALDATQLSSPSSSWDDASVEMLRIHVRGNPESGLVDIVCADTGSGIRTHQLKQLCCGMFETTKGKAARRGAKTSGKYGSLPFDPDVLSLLIDCCWAPELALTDHNL